MSSHSIRTILLQRNSLVRLGVWLLLVCLSGCALLHPPSASRPAQAESKTFVLNGRIAVNYQGVRHTAGLRWTHRMQSDEILLLTPLGQTVARMTSDAQQATLEQGERQYHAENLETLMADLLGWYLPLNHLRYWVLGVAAADSPAQIEHNSEAQVSRLMQDGWQVDYASYADAQPDSLPKRLQFSRAALQATLVIDGWEWSLP